MANLRDDLLPFLTKDEIKKLVRNLARQIEQDVRTAELILVCPLKGSIHFCADLMRELKVPCQVDFVQLQGSQRGFPVRLVKDISVSVMDKDVLIVEEIIDNGRSLTFLRDRILSAHPASLRIVTLLDKPSRRDLPIRADYVGRTIDDRYVVGYGMDSDEVGRNYPDIYFLKN